jgi:subtilisin family serine protease
MTAPLLRLLAALLLLGLPSASRPAEERGGEQILVMLRVPPRHFQPGGGYDGGYDAGRSQLKRQASRIARDHHLALVTDWPMPVLHLDCFVMRLPPGISASTAAQEVASDRRVKWSQPIHDYQTLTAKPGHDDALYPLQPAKSLWQLDRLHRLATGRGVTIAVIDSGIDARHPDLAGQLRANLNLVSGTPFAVERHGTAVAGIIAAKADNRIGIAGIAPGGRLLGLRACWQTSPATAAASCDSLSLAKALHKAIEQHAAIISALAVRPTGCSARSLT